jgi:site-specific DNA-methyltransferase (adenine-specific)
MIDLRLGDCLPILKGFADKSFDLVLTDPPYGIKINRNSNQFGVATKTSRKATDLNWDDNIPSKEYFDEIMRVSKNQIIFGANYFWEYFYSSQCYIIWDKRGDLPDVPFAPTEFAWTSFANKMSKRYVVRNHGFIRDSKDERTVHPTQKPSELFVKILQDFTNEGDTVLDPFLGSGTTLVACEKTNRNGIGIEKQADYFEIAQRRITEAQQQMIMPL